MAMLRTISVGGLVLALAGCNTSGSRSPATETEHTPTALNAGYGFRYDPMKWAKGSKSVQAAQVRTALLKSPLPGGKELLAKEVDSILAGQKDDGSFGENTNGALRRALRLRCSPGRPEVKRAVDYLVRNKLDEDGTLGIYRLRALCMSGDRYAEIRDRSLRKLADRCKLGIHGNCPWSPFQHLVTLWAGRHFMAVSDAMSTDLTWISEGLNEVGCLSYKDPWGFLELAGTIDHPMGRKIVMKQIPMILRSQRPDGGWGGQSFHVFRALTRYGFLDPLRELPPLPSDWRIVRAIPAPGHGLWSMTYGRGRLWVLSRGTNEAIAVSPDDGRVLQKLSLPVKGAVGIGWWDGGLAVTKGKPSEVVQVDPDTGKVMQRLSMDKTLEEPSGVAQAGRKLWLADGWQWVGIVVDLDRPEQKDYVVMGCPAARTDLAAAGDGIWHFAWHALVKTDAKAKPAKWVNETVGWDQGNAKVIDWGEKPFRGLTGIAWDGTNLWALDNVNQRICIIERVKAGEVHHGWLSAGTDVAVGPIFASGSTFDSARIPCHVENATRFPATATVALAPGSKLTADPSVAELAVPANTTGTRDIELRAPAPAAIRDLPVPVLDWCVTYRIDGGETHQAKGQLRVPILPQFDCARADGTIVVDGKLDDWPALPFVVDQPEQVKNRRTYTGPDDCRFRFGIVHDDRCVYIAVETTDDRQYLDPRKLVWQQDGVEIRLNAEPEPHRSHCHGWDVGWDRVLSVVCSPGQKLGDMVRWQHAKLPGGTQVACVTTGVGHNTEVAIPISYLDAKQGGPWQAFRLNVAVDDVDTDGQVAQLWWKPDWREMQTYAGSGTFRRK